MASNADFDSSVHKGSDLIHDYCCSTCEEDDVSKEAEFHCEKCAKFFCNVCVKLHNLLHRKHTVAGKQDISKWPVAKAIEDTLEQCQKHKDEKLKLFCEVHQQILCTVCHVYNHQKCSHIVLIADKLSALQKEVDFLQISTNLKKLREKINHEKQKKMGKLHSYQISYQKVIDEIGAFRKKMNDALDRLEKTTKQELDTLLTNLKTSIQTDIETLNNAHQKIQHLQDELQNIESKSPAVSFMLYTKCTDQSSVAHLLLQKLASSGDGTMSFFPDTTIAHALSEFTRLGKVGNNNKRSKYTTQHHKSTGIAILQATMSKVSTSIKPAISNPNQIIRVTKGIQYNVKTEYETYMKCSISGMCETASGNLLILDCPTVRLLSPTYTILDCYDVPDEPKGICTTDSHQVAVLVVNRVTVFISKSCQIHFITVKDDKILLEWTLNVGHTCNGIAHRRGKLFLNSGSAIYQYTIDRRQMRQLYGDSSDKSIVESCAVSPDGERIYMAKVSSSSVQLLTLSSDGRVLSTLTDPALKWSRLDYGCAQAGLHVTDSGQLLVCAFNSNTILQVDSDGKKRLAEMATNKDGVVHPSALYFSKRKSKLIVGMWQTDHILVFDAE
ncbi:uncharacterized protein LOC127868527 [Dreissena polymorpha]|uniref:B box-type domain-containing protein n=1 Tax=Dreissena polymorpha TaxID=45954 RepID=A0A9D4RLA9_DREPO|nr:uncharacterized protein LOC127868527 [Dreissena polymorpha]KAH3871588.1 hypothetical protein DPMN_034794 [Dreissena polymorpha]